MMCSINEQQPNMNIFSSLRQVKDSKYAHDTVYSAQYRIDPVLIAMNDCSELPGEALRCKQKTRMEENFDAVLSILEH